MQQVQECVCVNTVKRLTTCEASPWSHSPRRSCWTGRWWSWGPGWATRSLPGRIASPTTTSSGGTPQTCGTSKALCWFFFCYFYTANCRGVLRNATDLVDRIIRPSRVLFSSGLNCMMPGVSNFCLIHLHCCTSLMNMNSTPMCWQ